MLDPETDAILQACAGLSLLNKSKLVAWNAEMAKFEPIGHDAFELYWKRVDPNFGRLMCWMLFGAGAEFFAKGVCLSHKELTRTPWERPIYPTGNKDIEAWVREYLKDRKHAGTVWTIHYGTLINLTGDISQRSGENEAAIPRLCKAVNASALERDLLLAAYDLLRVSIRNRDMHAYAPNIRDSHFNVVPELFADCFNLLASWLPDGPSTLAQWRAQVKKLIKSL